MTPVKLRAAPAALGILLFAAGCDNAGSGLTTPLPGLGAMGVQVYLDRDGSSSLTPADTVFVGARVTLRSAAGGTVVRTLVTESNGGAVATDLSVGDYQVAVEQASIGDSLVVAPIDIDRVRVQATGAAPVVVIRLGYPTMSVRQARLQPAGRRILIRGLILAGIQSFRDTTSHLRDTSLAIRLTRASLRNGGGGNFPGDTVTVLGTVSARAGQPTLDQALITVFGNRPAPVALPVTSSVAASAQGGLLDASLVLVSNAVISESGAQAPDYRVVANDGSGPLTIIFDGAQQVNPAALAVARTISVRGVLVPDGSGRWRLKPRDGNDLTVF